MCRRLERDKCQTQTNFLHPWNAVERILDQKPFSPMMSLCESCRLFCRKPPHSSTITSSSDDSFLPTSIPIFSSTARSVLCTIEKSMVHSTANGRGSSALQKHKRRDVRPTLLGIPKQIRKRILKYACFHPEYPIVLWKPLSVSSEHYYISGSWDRRYLRIEKVKFPASVLRACKALYHESMQVFYSENTFRISCSVDWPEYVLHAFWTFWSYLRTLQLEASIPRDGLRYSDYNFHRTLELWQRICGHLSYARVTLDTVTFSFVGINSAEQAEVLLIGASGLAPSKIVRFVAEFFDNDKKIISNKRRYNGDALPCCAQVNEHGHVGLGLGFSGVCLTEDFVNKPPEELPARRRHCSRLMATGFFDGHHCLRIPHLDSPSYHLSSSS